MDAQGFDSLILECFLLLIGYDKKMVVNWFDECPAWGLQLTKGECGSALSAPAWKTSQKALGTCRSGKPHFAPSRPG